MRTLLLALAVAASSPAADKIRVLLIDGQNNHKWMETTPVLKKILDDSGLFTVDVATTPPAKADMSSFQPNFAAYKVVVSNYNGDDWPAATKAAFEKFISGGGGFVSVHAADNAFPEWTEYNQMIALGGWGDRTERHGPYAKFKDGKVQTDMRPGRGGHHGKRHPFLMTTRDTAHPITKGLPAEWLHVEDELYDSLRGPAQNMHILSTAYSDPATGGTGDHELMLFTVSYGKGRVFHTTLGHDVLAMSCVGFRTTLLRGTEWSATGKVTQKPPADFPTATTTRQAN